MRDIDVKSYALGYDSGSKTGGGYPEPSGTKNISSNGDYNIKDYATAHVDVPQGITPTGTRTITQNGVYNVTEYASADVQVEESTTSLTDLNATANGTYNHDGYDGYDQVVVNVPNPSTGTLNITSNGDYDVTSKATAHVAVPEPTPVAPDLVDLTVTENGTYTHTGHDGYDEVVVNVPQGSTPTGSINITSNGTTDVTNYASAVVNVANTYSNSDEDKVVHNGALVTQTSTTVTSNGTIDTTTNNQVVVNVPDSGTPAIGCVITENSTNNTFTYDIYGTKPYGYLPCAWPDYDLYLPRGASLVVNIHSQNAIGIPSHFLQGNQSYTYGGPRPVYITLPDSIETIDSYAFHGCAFANTTLTLPSSLSSIRGNIAFGSSNLQVVIFRSTPTIHVDTFNSCTDLTDIYVPWSNGEVAYAPWGATNATIHYNWTA